MKKRIISIILSIVMLVGLLPTTALAEEPDTLVPSCTCGASADADGVISHISDCPLYYNIAAANEPEAADPECTCGAVPDEDGVTSHGEECPLYTGSEEEPEEKPAEELAAPAVLERPYDEETSSDTVLYVDGQWDAYCWEIYTDDTFEWAVYADTAEIVVDKETYVASAFRCTVTLGEQSAVTEPAVYNTELIEPTVSLWNTRIARDQSDYMVWTKDDSVFNIRGLDGNYEFQTTFMDYGYRSWIEVDGISREGTGGQLRDGLTYDITPSLVYDGRYVKITYTVENTGSKTYTFRVGSAADVMIDNNDKAPVVGLTGGGGLKMSGSPKNDYTFNLVAPSADTLWYGYWRMAGKNVFTDRTDKTETYNKDSGMAWSWTDEVINPGQRWERSVLIGVGELPDPAEAPDITMPEFVAGESGTISGTATPGDTVYVTVDGKEYSDTADKDGKFSMEVSIPAEQPDDTLDVTYYAVSPEGGISGITSEQVNVATAPRITLKQSGLTLMEEDTAPDLRSFIADSEGEVSIAPAAVNTNILGTYTVTYTASVGDFPDAAADLTVTVVPKPAELTAASCTDSSALFTLTATMKYTGGNTYTETGFVYAPYHYPTLTDNAGTVVTSSPVNTKGGTLSASVADSALIHGVSYYARPYAKFGDGNAVIYGGESGNFGLNVPSYGSVQISNNGDNTFTVSRTEDSDGEQIVHFRTVNGSAVGGTHFTHQVGTVTIPDGEMTAGTTISIAELGVNQTYGGKAATGYSNADRTYQVEIYLVEGGASIGTGKATRTMTKNSEYVIDRTIYSEWKTQTKSDEVLRGDYNTDGYGWTEDAQGSAAQEKFKIADTPGFLQRDYWMNTADAVKFQLQFSAREEDGGYQHIQITPGQSLDLKIHPESGSWNGTQSTTLYVATFEHGGDGHADKDYATYYFPKASGSNEYIRSETFYGAPDSEQYVRLPVATEYVSVGYTGSGTGEDKWLTKDQYNRFMLKDTKEPQLLGIAPMADTTYVPGQEMTLALIFDEIVDQENSVAAGLTSTVLYVDWTGDSTADAQFNYAGGLNTNVLYFTCTLPETMDITDECTLKLLSNSELFTKIKDMCNESVTSSAGYNDKTVTAQFNSTEPSVDIGPLSTDAAGFTSGTITASHFTKLEYVWSQDSSIPVAGWESVARSGTTVKTRQTEGTWYLHARATNDYGRTATAAAAITFAADGNGGTPVVLPELEVTVDNTNWVKEQRVISITRQPDTAAVKVTKPGGSEETVSGNTYTATTNDIYTFTLTSGSETITKMVNVARIDLNAPTVSIKDLTDFTHTAAVTLTVTAADTESGLAATPLAGVWKNGEEEVDATFTSAGDGVWTTTSPDATGNWVLTVTATDAVGRTSSDTSETYTIHADRPTITISNRRETDAGITYDYAVQENGNTDVIVTLPDGTTTTELTETVLLTEPGSYYIFVTDALGHYVQSEEMTVPQSTTENPVDYTAPDVRYDTAPYVWTNADAVTVTLNIFEEQGLDSVTYRKLGAEIPLENLTGGTEVDDYTYTTSFTVTENGTYTVTAKDIKGNAGTMDVVVDFIDRTKPAVTFSGTFNQWMNAEQTITLRPADPDVDGDNEDASGVAKVEYAVSADKTAVPAAPTVLENPYQVTISENGTWYIYYKITDNAGNVATGWSEAVKVDKETPVITVDTSAAMAGASEQTVTVTATFGVSGGAVTVGEDTVLTMVSTAQSGTYTEEKTNTYVIRAKGVYDFVVASAAGKTNTQTVTVYGIDFDSNGGRNAGGNEVADQIVVSGGKATAPETIARTGYTFKEWQKSGATYEFANIAVTADVALKAAWTLDVPAVSVAADHESIVYGDDADNNITLTATPGHAANDVTYSYQWYKGMDAVAGATESVLNLTDVSESGSYTVKVTATNQDSPALVSPTVESGAVTVTIHKKPITLQWKGTQYTYGESGLTITPVVLEDNPKAEGTDPDDVYAVFEAPVNAGSHTLTVALAGARLGNYDYSGADLTGTVVVQKAPVTFAVSGNLHAHDGGAKSVTVAPSAADLDALGAVVTYKQNDKVVAEPSAVGSYDVCISFTNSNYRHAARADGSELVVGVLVIHAENAVPSTYQVTFTADGAQGAVPAALEDVLPGTVVTLPDAGTLTMAGHTLEGWKWNSTLYRPGETLVMPHHNITLAAQWVENHYSVSGTVTRDGDVVANAVIPVMSGGTVVGEVVTNDEGVYSIEGLTPGVYDLVVKYDGVVTTMKVVIEDDADGANDAVVMNVTLPVGNTNSVVEVTAGTPEVVVGGLDQIFNDENTTVYTPDDKTAVSSGGAVEIKLIVTAVADTTTDPERAAAQSAIMSKTKNIGLILDLDLYKTLNGGTPEQLSTSGNILLETVIPLPAELQNKHSYLVYRYHGGEVQRLTTSPNQDGERIEISKDKTTLTVYANKYSLYTVAYENPSSSSGSSAVNLPKNTPNGTVAVNPSRADFLETVTITATPKEGYRVGSIVVADRNGKEIAVTDLGKGKYTFKMPIGAVSVEVVFVPDSPGYADCPKDESCPISQFTDASAVAWYHDGVHYCIENNLMSGYGNGIFKPNTDTSRAMIAVMLWRLEGSPVVNYLLDFEDVKAEAWYTEAIRWAKSEGIIGGYGNGCWGPDDAVTREQMVTILWRYAQYKGYDVSVGENTNILSYDDAFDVAEYAIPAMQWACGSGMVQGMNDPDGEGMILAPESKGTRAQIATMIMRFCEEILK